jgi:hypothetical protein
MSDDGRSIQSLNDRLKALEEKLNDVELLTAATVLDKTNTARIGMGLPKIEYR